METNRLMVGEREQMLVQARVGASVRALAGAHGTQQKELAVVLGMSQNAVSLKLRGRTRWSVADIEKVSAFYGASVEQIQAGPWAWLGLPEAPDLGVSNTGQ